METIKILTKNLTLGNTGYFFDNNPRKIQFKNLFCKFCFYRGLDMYIDGKNPKYEASSF